MATQSRINADPLYPYVDPLGRTRRVRREKPDPIEIIEARDEAGHPVTVIITRTP